MWEGKIDKVTFYSTKKLKILLHYCECSFSSLYILDSVLIFYFIGLVSTCAKVIKFE